VVLKLRYISNFTDVDALATEPGVRVRFSLSPADIERADLVIIPGTKATVEDLARLPHAALKARRGPILGICGGYQMLGTEIVDAVESRAGTVPGLGLLPVSTHFAADKLLTNRSASSMFGPVSGYEIRHGRLTRHGGEPLIGEDEGCRVGSVLGTSWHGVLEHDAFRRALLGWVADRVGRRFAPGNHAFADIRAERLDAIGDLVEQHLDTAALTALIEGGAPPQLPIIDTEARPVAGIHHHR
jgi:adenosylcobyric acid synthase